MIATPDDPAPPPARQRRSRWIGAVWAVPLAALLIVGFLGVRGIADRGIDIVITFDDAAGARVGDTKVIYQGVEGGTVRKIDINPDGRRVDVTVRMDPRAKPALTTKTIFWIVGIKPSLSDFASVKAAVAGPSIGVAPSTEGEPTRRFRGRSEPPVVLPGTPGTAYVLTADRLGSARAGSSVYYRGQDIGRVTASTLVAPGAFKLDIFVFAPYDRLVGPAATFWISSPVDVSLTANGATADLRHAGSLFNGAIEFDAVVAAAASGAASQPVGQQRPAGSAFVLYHSRDEARDGPSGPEVAYAFAFDGPGGELQVGAPVRLHGFTVGAVTAVQLRFDTTTTGNRPMTAVRALLYPQKLQLALPGAAPAPAPAASAAASAAAAAAAAAAPAASAAPAAAAAAAAAAGDDAARWRRVTDAAVARLLAQGYRAQLAQRPPLIGGRIVALEPVAGAGPVALVAGDPPRIPSVAGAGSIDDMTRQANEILAKLNRVPIEAIGADVRQITARLNGLVSSPQVSDSLRKLDDSLNQVDRLLADVRPRVKPLLDRLDHVADELAGAAAAARQLLDGGSGGAPPDTNLPDAIRDATDAARSVRALSDYLRRHPEALLRGRRGDAPAETPAKNKESSR